MRKIAILGACILAAFAANAQQDEVKELFLSGKANYAEYDDLLGKKASGKLPEGGEVQMANLLLQGYETFNKVLPLDSLPNAKGKVKPKYSKEIHNTVAGHYTDYNNAAIAYWEAKDYDKAYQAWELFCTIPEKFKVANVPADTVMGEIRYNQALAAWQNEHFDQALQSFLKAKSLGYNKKNLYDYAIAVASQAKNDDAVYELAKEAQALYGQEDPNYIGYMINRYLQNKEYDQAFTIIDEAIAGNPGNAQYYVVKGILLGETGKKDEAKALYKKAVDLDAYNSMALYQYGRALCEEAYALGEVAPTSPKESQEFFDSKIKPLFLEAAEYLENAYNVDNNNTDALRYLENVYYNLNDEAKLKDVQDRLK